MAHPRRATTVTSLCLLALVFGCGDDAEEPAPSTSSRNRRGVGTFEREESPARGAATPVDEGTMQPVMPLAPSAPSAVEEEKKEERDLGAELAAALGSPAACLKPRVAAGAPKSLVISIEAVVTENGIVTRGSASGPSLDAQELECVRKQVLALRMRAPIEQAPRTVQGTITLELQQPPPAAAPVAPTPP